MYVYHSEEPMGASRNFIRGIKKSPPPIEKRGPERKESIRKAPAWQKILLKKKNRAEKHPPPPHKEKISSKNPLREKKS